MSIADISRCLSRVGLGQTAIRIYSFAAARAAITLDELTGNPDFPAPEVGPAVEQLLSLRLIVRNGDASEEYAALPPDLAVTLLLGRLDRQITQVTLQASQVRRDLMQLTQVYDEANLARLQGQRIETVQGLQQVRDLIGELSEECQTEVLTSQPGGARSEEVLAESLDRTERLLARGIKMRTLYQHTAQFGQATIAYVERVTALGAEVRTLADGFPRMIVFDRRLAIVDSRQHSHSALLIRSPCVVDFITRTFNWAWVGATSFPTEYRQEHIRNVSDEIRQTITELLVVGEDDRVIARRLGLSLRSVQRHIAEIMQQLGAANRLHAGYLLGHAHHLGRAG
ncbi:LuxR C-terminal-related transcriptional regulator [Kitasatospora sp. NPDC101157]|uniref:LuxR C-terminal-related transcriptional regulator n=1 Tax=Kitasatospora sp. NPDC101157 TaxID=3364098 RepID=UPI0038029052